MGSGSPGGRRDRRENKAGMLGNVHTFPGGEERDRDGSKISRLCLTKAKSGLKHPVTGDGN